MNSTTEIRLYYCILRYKAPRVLFEWRYADMRLPQRDLWFSEMVNCENGHNIQLFCNMIEVDSFSLLQYSLLQSTLSQ